MTQMKLPHILAVLILAILLVSCVSREGDRGPIGPAGPVGPGGPQGPTGPQGEPGQPAPVNTRFVGDQTCQLCHPDIYNLYQRSGHAWSLNTVVANQPPEYPFSQVLNPPEGYSWSDIAYVIGGYAWSARFIDREGYIITDAPEAVGNRGYLNQWNLSFSGRRAEWVSFNPGKAQETFNCGNCHTTGYKATGSKDGLSGVIGTWEQDGIRCEACHGPGSEHVTAPRLFEMKVDDSSRSCKSCHVYRSVHPVDLPASAAGKSEHYKQVYTGKHMVLDCVDCHDPHAGVVQHRQKKTSAIRVTCESCHYEQAKYQNNRAHSVMKLACAECHMPSMLTLARSAPDLFVGDIRAHNPAIDPTLIEQADNLRTGESQSISPIGLNYACRHCHNPSRGLVKTDAELIANATGYHDRP
jgi:hypothetical protein